MSSSKSGGVGIKFPAATLAQLDAIAAERDVSRAEIVRIAVAIGLPLLKLGVAINTRRALGILEHTQLALSMIVEREYPDDAQTLIDMARQNVSDFHA